MAGVQAVLFLLLLLFLNVYQIATGFFSNRLLHVLSYDICYDYVTSHINGTAWSQRPHLRQGHAREEHYMDLWVRLCLCVSFQHCVLIHKCLIIA